MQTANDTARGRDWKRVLGIVAFVGLAAGGLAGTAVRATGDRIVSDPLPAEFQAELEALVDQYDLPGATAAYVLTDGTIGTAAAGLADTAAAAPMTANSRMLAASVGKTFVAAVMVALDRDSVLALDDLLVDWLGDRPWYDRLPNARTITLRHLLRHTAGLHDHVHDDGFCRAWRKRRHDGDVPFTPDELVAFVLGRDPLFAPGDGWSYSDTGYILLGLVIEEATGRTYEQIVRQRFLDPLALEATTPSNRPDLPGLAAGYLSPDNPFGLPVVTTLPDGTMAWHPGIEWTGGGLVSTSRDLAVWAWSLFGGRVPPADATASLTLGADDDGEAGYGLGVSVRPAGPLGQSWGHGGWIPGYVTSMRYYPTYDVAVVFQINTDVGLGDPARPVADEMERRLATLVIRNAQDRNQVQ